MFLYTSNEQFRNEIKKMIPFTISSKWIKYIEMNFNKISARLVDWKPYNIAERIKEYLNKSKDSSYSRMRILTMVKMAILHKLIYTFNGIHVTILAGIIVELDKIILRFIWKCEGYQIAKALLKKKNKVGGLTLIYFKTYYKATVIKTVVLA